MKQKGFSTALILIVVAMLTLGGYLYYQKQNKPVILQQTSQTSQSSIDQTANWKTYKGKYWYSIKYPSSWKIQDLTQSCFGMGVGVFPEEVSVQEKCTQTGQEIKLSGGSWLYISTSGLIGDLESYMASIITYSTSENAQNKKAYIPNGEGKGIEGNLIKKESIILDGVKALKQTFKTSDGYRIIIVADHNTGKRETSGGVFLEIISSEGSLSSKYQDILDKIIATFKFTSVQK